MVTVDIPTTESKPTGGQASKYAGRQVHLP